MKQQLLIVVVLALMVVACIGPAQPIPKQSKQVMVVSANPHATQAGLKVLEAGGSAVDAAIAIEAVLSLVEPQSSGLAGGGFMVHLDGQSGELSVYDGRETAPSGATPDMFLDKNAQRMGFLEAKNSGLSTGVPGILAMLDMAHKEKGKLAWQVLFADAKRLANEGFAISPRLHASLQRYGKYIPSTRDQGPTDAYQYLFDHEGQAKAVGHILKNPDYAASLDLISADVQNFYQGKLAEDIAAMVQQSPRAGSLSAEDISAYRPVKRKVLCQPFKDMQLCGPPPPSSWLAVGMIMTQLEQSHDFSSSGAEDPKNWALFAQSQQLAYADRDHYVGDPAFVDVPVSGLLNQDYLHSRAKLINREKALSELSPGKPWAYMSNKQVKAYGLDNTLDVQGTTHFVVVDAQGDVVSMTATVESAFGSTRMVGGMFLNNQLTDFSFTPKDVEGRQVANAVAPGKRPRSSMSPTIVLDKEGQFLMATGSPGGSNIIAYTAKTLVGVFDWGLSPQQAVDLPNMVARGQTVRLEKDLAPKSLVSEMRAMGFKVDASRGENSGLSVILRLADGTLQGGVDQRREGTIGVLTTEVK